jgi:hypothetical protein
MVVLKESMTPEQLIAIFPKLDHLQAETILKLEERGELEKYLVDDEEPTENTSTTIVGAVTVETP